MKTKISSLRGLIYGLLVSQGMTASELVGCLMSEPYNLKPDDLGPITLALDGLLEGELLKVSVKLNLRKFEIEPIFNPTFPRHPLDQS